MAVNFCRTSGELRGKVGDVGSEVIVMSAPIVLYGHDWVTWGWSVASGLKEMSNGRAFVSDGRWRFGSMSHVEVGRRYPAAASAVGRMVARPSRRILWAFSFDSRWH